VFVPLGSPSSRSVPGARIEYANYTTQGSPIAGETILIDGLAATQIDALLEIELADGTTHSAILKPANPSFVIPAIASSWEVAKSYWYMGVEHILSGIDHLMFVLALMLLIRNNWMLFKAITAFTISHSITLGLSTLGLVHIPTGPTEAVIALSIVFLASELIRSREGKFSLSEQHPWIVAFAFGLFHGLGFAGALTELGLPEHAIPMALVSFNVGVECGQLLFIGVLLAIMFALRKVKFAWPAGSWRMMPYIIGSMASFWFIQRLGSFL
jgi:hydrogenase/urease accessory protein HupE